MGDWKLNRKIEVDGKEWVLSAWGASLPKTARQRIIINGKTPYWFAKTVPIPKVNHPGRRVLLWRDEQQHEPPKGLVTNRTRWELIRILTAYRQRWTGTATFDRDGKQHLGMGECQLRSGAGQTRPM